MRHVTPLEPGDSPGRGGLVNLGRTDGGGSLLFLLGEGRRLAQWIQPHQGDWVEIPDFHFLPMYTQGWGVGK